MQMYRNKYDTTMLQNRIELNRIQNRTEQKQRYASTRLTRVVSGSPRPYRQHYPMQITPAAWALPAKFKSIG